MLGYLPTVLPPAAAVRAVSPDAAKAVAAFEQLDASLPVRRSGEQLDAVDEACDQARGELTDSFFEAVASEEVELRAKLVDEIGALGADWRRLETLRGLKTWRSRPTSYRSEPIQVLAVPAGGGGSRPLFASEVLRALRDAIERGH